MKYRNPHLCTIISAPCVIMGLRAITSVYTVQAENMTGKNLVIWIINELVNLTIVNKKETNCQLLFVPLSTAVTLLNEIIICNIVFINWQSEHKTQ